MSPGSTSVTGSLSFRIGFRALNRMLYPSSLTCSAVLVDGHCFSPQDSVRLRFVFRQPGQLRRRRFHCSSDGQDRNEARKEDHRVPSGFGFAFMYNRSMMCSTMVSTPAEEREREVEERRRQEGGRRVHQPVP